MSDSAIDDLCHITSSLRPIRWVRLNRGRVCASLNRLVQNVLVIRGLPNLESRPEWVIGRLLSIAPYLRPVGTTRWRRFLQYADLINLLSMLFTEYVLNDYLSLSSS